MKQAKVRLKCVYGEHKPGEEVTVDYAFAESYAKQGWLEILDVVEAQEEAKEETKEAVQISAVRIRDDVDMEEVAQKIAEKEAKPAKKKK